MVYDKEDQETFLKQFLISANNPNTQVESVELIDYCDCAKEMFIKDINCIQDKDNEFHPATKLPNMYFCREFNLKCSRTIWEEHQQELKLKKD